MGINSEGEFWIMYNGEPVVGFTPDYAYKLYLSMHAYYSGVQDKMS